MRRALVGTMFLVVGLTAACGDPTEAQVEGEDDLQGTTQIFEVETPAGPVTCISWKDGYGGGLDCNWPTRGTR